jgi:hypothetical protein
MVANFSFIEITTNLRDFDYTVDKLTNLGFTVVAKNSTSVVSVWKLNLCIIFLRKDTDYDRFPAITGLGLIADSELISKLECEYCEELDFFVTKDPVGNNVYLLPIENYKKSVISKKYTKFKSSKQLNTHLLSKHFSGVVYNCFDEDLGNFYLGLGFRVTKTGSQYINMVSENNRFTIMFNYKNNEQNIKCLIAETEDIFHSTAYYSYKNFDLQTYDQPAGNDFGSLTYKINGYNCFALGNKDSFTIENNLQNVLPDLNFVLRQRQKYIHINEDALLEHMK